jgi:hypothetical protein
MAVAIRHNAKETDGEKLSAPVAGESPSPLLGRTAARVVADSFMVHSGVEKREAFHRELRDKLDETDIDERVVILAGLKEAGLGYKRLRGETSVRMRSPMLSNPDPAEFSSKLSSAIKRGTALEVLEEKGQEVLGTTEGETDMTQWLEHMEIAVRKSYEIIPGGADG